MTIVLIRHAERDPSADALSDAGRRRAAGLARMFRDAGVTAIFTSEFTRTIDTARPLAAALGLEPVRLFSNLIAARNQILGAGPLPVVVGHTDTVPRLVTALGGTSSEIAEHEFDRMFILTVAGATVTTLVLRY